MNLHSACPTLFCVQPTPRLPYTFLCTTYTPLALHFFVYNLHSACPTLFCVQPTPRLPYTYYYLIVPDTIYDTKIKCKINHKQ